MRGAVLPCQVGGCQVQLDLPAQSFFQARAILAQPQNQVGFSAPFELAHQLLPADHIYHGQVDLVVPLACRIGERGIRSLMCLNQP